MSDDKRLDTNEMTDAAVNDEDDTTATKAESKIVTDVDNSTNKLGVESRYFAVVVDNPEDIIDANSIAIAKEVTEKILEAMKEANVTVLIGSRKEQCFIGYALSLSGDILFDTVQKSSRHKTALNIRWGKICCLPFRDTVKIRNAFNDDKPVSQFLTGQVYIVKVYFVVDIIKGRELKICTTEYFVII